MARNTQDIYQEMLIAKQDSPEMDVMDSPSNTAFWQLILRFLAQIHHWMEEKWDAFKVELQAVIDSSQYGTFEWWERIIREFQYGDELFYINNRWQYLTIDKTKQIIAYVSIDDPSGVVKPKVAKMNNNRPLLLSADEAAALSSYLRKRRPPGTRLLVQSLPADKLKAYLTIHYNAQVGEAAIKVAVEQAYLNYINNLDFNGVFYINKLIDKLQSIPAVINEQVEVINISVKQGTDDYVQFLSKYQAVSGYFEIDSDFPLSNTITYIGV